jgi:guanylate kinase
MTTGLKGWERPDQGALFVVSGASGSGKTTLLERAFSRLPELEFSVSATTRSPREGETDGADYHFLDAEAFEQLRTEGALLEWAEVYGCCYGTPRAPVEHALSVGRSILLDIDVQGTRQVREHLPDAVTIGILPPDLDTLANRLRQRSLDSEEVIQRRIAEAMVQIEACGEFDYLVVNDDLETARTVFEGILLSELSRTCRRPGLVEKMTGLGDKVE